MPEEKPSLKNLTQTSFGRIDKKQLSSLQELTKPHIESFNHMVKEGLNDSVRNIPPVEFELPNKQRVSLYLTDATLFKPTLPQGNNYALTSSIFPAECRAGGKTYSGRLQVRLCWDINGCHMGSEDFTMGEVPVMVKSAACNLHGMKPNQLVQHGEEEQEMGGYFIINGLEKVIRMLVLPRRNFPIAIKRPSWRNRGPEYTELGISVRCVKMDQTAAQNILHYRNNGTAIFCFMHNKEQFFMPVILVLKALIDETDQYIYTELIKGKEDNSFYKGCIAAMLRQSHEEGLSRRSEILDFIGRSFKVKLFTLPKWYTNRQLTEFLLKHYVCTHLNSNKEKFDFIVYMTSKLFSFASGECAAESADNPMFHDVLLSGHLYQMLLKEKIENWLNSLHKSIEHIMKLKSYSDLDLGVISKACRTVAKINTPMTYFMATGNLVSNSNLGLMQTTGLSILADKLNFMRYISHFRCLHRGAFFASMRTTSVRRLLPEAWGFICPVHTPDGPPCGLMNHLSASCQVVNHVYDISSLPSVLCELGMTPLSSQPPCLVSQCYTVLLDGCVLGWVPHTTARAFTDRLRRLKVKGLKKVPRTMEVVLLEKTPVASQYPGIYLFTSLARLLRPVKNLAYDAIEMIGTFEQPYLNICVIPEEAHEGVTTHQELSESTMLSAVACLTPFSDFNQSPRNMYQCQMGKQTMGIPLHAWQYRSDNKLYKLQTPQSPLVRPATHDHYGMDNYPLGTNAVVAVISYTGYDMEDAMILNKSSYERGFGHGTIYKSEFINLMVVNQEQGKSSSYFALNKKDEKACANLDDDGLPPVGTYLQRDDPYYSYVNIHTGVAVTKKYSGEEAAWVDHIKICGHDLGNVFMTKVCIVLRVQRNPIIGDKFSSRHGQKGVCSQKWPVEDMPFSESGMTPDILFNPHGFPSRMTIGMMIESMAGKSAALHGLCHDATPFTFSEKEPAIDHFGDMLTAAGYNYFGTERMYGGIDGREFEVDIFVGIVYYQRLRHMVSDKFQVRTTGKVDPVTHQPIQGRKRGGGVRFGEMERDGLLAHGTSFLLQDRLLNCSDESKAYICKKCGSILSPLIDKPAADNAAASREIKRQWKCMSCQRKDTVCLIRIPHVFKYLVAELAAMNIKTNMKVEAM